MATTTSTPSNITLHPVEPSDFLTLATIEALTYDADDFSVVAFGRQRHSHENLSLRASAMSFPVAGNRDLYTKVLLHPSKRESPPEIIAFAGWGFVPTRDLPAEAASQISEKEKRSKMSVEERNRDDVEMWGPEANVKFCEDAFLVADEIMEGACEGKGYCKLRTLAVHPSYQRMGIGTMLLKQGLAEADKLGLQCVLAASPEGEELYKRFGFIETEVMRFRLWEYEGGEAMEGKIARHVVMRRPPVSVDN